MKFTLEIELGNDRMQSCSDIGLALQAVTEKLFERELDSPVSGLKHYILDLNGDIVGKWEVSA